jgi:hypothetical protein
MPLTACCNPDNAPYPRPAHRVGPRSGYRSRYSAHCTCCKSDGWPPPAPACASAAAEFGIDIQVALRPAVGAMHLQQFALPDQVANRHRSGAELLLLATAPGLISILLKLDQLGRTRDQLTDPSSLVIGQAAGGERNCSIRLAIDLGQDNPISVNDPLAGGYRFDGPGLGKAT